jgi:hypothetical protein
VADKGYIAAVCRPIKDEATRNAVTRAFEYVLDNMRLGVPEHQKRATNSQQYWLASTTAASTGEFSVQHGLQTTPRYALAVLDLAQPGAKLVPLEVSRAADDRRVYLKSTSTGAPIVLLVEA